MRSAMSPEGPWRAIRAAAADRVSGASEIARMAAEALAALPRRDLPDASAALVRGHPSMAPLWRLASSALEADDHAEAARSFVRALDREREEVARAGAEALRNAAEVILHSYSGTLVAAVAAAGCRALCARSEPGGEGARTAERLRAAGVDARVVEDEEARAAAREAPVLVGADAIGPGGVVNKVGTASLAEAAGRSGAPCRVLAGTHKLLAADVPTVQPFERTPLDSFASIVTDEGPLATGDLHVERFPVHPALVGLLEEMRA